MAVIWGAFAMMEGINYVFNTMAPYIAVNMLVSVLGLFAMTLLYDAKVAKRIVAVVVFQVTAIVSEILQMLFLVVPEKYFQDINVLGMFISKLFLLVFLMILMLLQKKQKNIPTHYLITYFAIPIACIFVLCVLYRKSMYIDYISYIATGCIMLLNIVSYYLLDELSDYIIRASKVFQLNNQLETQRKNMNSYLRRFDPAIDCYTTPINICAISEPSCSQMMRRGRWTILNVLAEHYKKHMEAFAQVILQ